MAGADLDKSERGDPENRLPLTPVTLNILLALADEERHGYGIMLEVSDRTGGKMRIGPGTLYSSIRRLVEGRLIEESEARPAPESDDERRRYYRLTDFGRKVLAAEIRRLESTVRAARKKGAYPAPGTAVGPA
ncbi:MAG: PadR family transcriptional regulator [Rubrobacteraceae bacterium]